MLSILTSLFFKKASRLEIDECFWKIKFNDYLKAKAFTILLVPRCCCFFLFATNTQKSFIFFSMSDKSSFPLQFHKEKDTSFFCFFINFFKVLQLKNLVFILREIRCCSIVIHVMKDSDLWFVWSPFYIQPIEKAERE